MILIKEGNSYKKIDEKEKFLKENKGIYRFYVQENKFNSICDKLDLDKTIKNTVENIPYKEETYYCVYVGKTTSKIGYYGRIVKGHLKLKTTLRKSFEGILNDKNCSNTFREECIFLIEPKNCKDLENIDQNEIEEINKCFHILNLDDNKFYLESKDNIKSLLKAINLRR